MTKRIITIPSALLPCEQCCLASLHGYTHVLIHANECMGLCRDSSIEPSRLADLMVVATVLVLLWLALPPRFQLA